MNFVRAMLGAVDALWSLLTIPCLLVAGSLLINYLPIPTLVVMSMFVYYQFVQADFYARLVGMSGGNPDDPQHIRVRVKHIVSGFILIGATVFAYGFFVRYIINHGMLCDDWSGYIPGNLPWMLQKVVPHKCAVA